MQKIRPLDKRVDELNKGKTMEKILGQSLNPVRLVLDGWLRLADLGS
jgi:hypothetical protein